jgi:hypothetical protein
VAHLVENWIDAGCFVRVSSHLGLHPKEVYRKRDRITNKHMNGKTCWVCQWRGVSLRARCGQRPNAPQPRENLCIYDSKFAAIKTYPPPSAALTQNFLKTPTPSV